jgi:hypothetical protein
MDSTVLCCEPSHDFRLGSGLWSFDPGRCSKRHHVYPTSLIKKTQACDLNGIRSLEKVQTS